MAHTPVNHPLRPIYRIVGFITGAYLVAFGLIGFITTSGEEFTGPGERVLGQGSNMLWSIISLVLGAIVLLATAVGRNIDVAVDQFLGWGLLVVGTYQLAVLRTDDLNIFGFTMSTVVVTYLVGLLLITVSLYSKSAPKAQAGAPRQVREGRTA
ncbi:hypothetical protein FHR83_004856 [Actinoplanes campanulatus]|uniref:DUF4383 domain-containing protein n=1 Tax=Actinoplanes campanulatus TaxID=113559 RepID=A0A7W5FG55_9ACTN|nr:DUF4383 domain-containing protein [Actinoplanes campanulatus]MBB3097181.1 hypothetical protein [Actinoplanes campanulatus]GGN16259.1 hypothetical protein GCM10010109_28400 [Actinoplanes campanulatus]GID37637.1 hypothetical protein Aca09nite_41430 [Actinoplanes campanulatus]